MTPLQRTLINAGDWLLGWALHLPRDLTLIVIAALTAGVLLGFRALLIDRNLLSRLEDDEQRLRELCHTAREQSNTVRLQQHQTVRRHLAARRLRLEALPVLAGLVPALLIITWGRQRLDHFAIQPNEPFEFTATLPASQIGKLVHLVPQDGLTTADGWIKKIEPLPTEASPEGIAIWTLTATSRLSLLTLRTERQTIEHPVFVGRPAPPDAHLNHDGDIATRLQLPQYRPLGVVPGIPLLGIPPWLLGLIILSGCGLIVVTKWPGLKRR